MKVSIIIPAYNCEKYIRRCLDSVIEQEGAEKEIIVINDGSTDGTGEILDSYGDKIVLKTTENRGSSSARNTGIDMISGDYVMFLDSDDYLESGAIARLSDIISKTEADIIKFRYRLIFPNGTSRVAENQFEEYDVIDKKDFRTKIYPYFMSGIRLNSMCVGIYRSNLIKGHKFREDMQVAEDAVFALYAYTKASKAVIIPDILYNYYQTGEGLTGSGAKILRKYRCNFIFAKETEKLLKEWDMDTPFTRLKVYSRPFFLTFDKVRRIIRSKN